MKANRRPEIGRRLLPAATFHVVVLPDAQDIELQWQGEYGPIKLEEFHAKWFEETADLAWRSVPGCG